ncbi:hypothetical protein GCM10010503_09300 [Streptomyces lucensis JCM 4490]|uniref:RDD domain-containing protein n=1 Tax=Streptomyces lucensis JCM 4490 TaxID=1306176 RepID=A0A918MM78_9ACTN|nr:RDD family protein [Streptomyces lucensis]GGW35706.1 hypothetical protein GCM10010503_09300 [Streptomyces lucensis JCM 4490]
MSAPTPAPGDDRPREGYYPDPSIPGYVRYWNGASWVPGTSRPAPKDGEPLNPPPGVRPAAPAVEETGPHFFDEDPQPHAADAGDAGPGGEPWGSDPRRAAQAPAGPADEGPDPSGTFLFRRPVPGPAAVPDEGTMTFRPVPGQDAPGARNDAPGAGGAHVPGQGTGPGGHTGGTGSGVPGFGVQGPVSTSMPSSSMPSSSPAPAPAPPGSAPSTGPGFGAGKAAAARAAVQPPQTAQPAQGSQGYGYPQSAQPPQGSHGYGYPQSPPSTQTPQSPHAPQGSQGYGYPQSAQGSQGYGYPPPAAHQSPVAPASVSPPVPQQAGPGQGGAAGPLSAGPGGGQSSWAQQVHQLAGGAEEQPVAPWKPPVEDPFQAAARRQAAARPAGLGKRFAARLIDSLVVAAVTAAAAVPLGLQAADHIQQKIDAARLSGRTVTVWLLDGTTGTSLGIVLGVLLLSGLVYEVLPTAKWGRTLGKKLCGLEVRDIEAHEAPTFGAALRRWLVYSVPGLLGVGVVGVLWCVFDRPWHQCWHDKAARTFVAG